MTTTRLNDLFRYRDQVGAERHTALSKCDDMIYAVLQPAWDDCKALQAALGKLEQYNADYGADEGGVYAWVRADLDIVDERERPYFDDYLLDRGVTADYANDALVAHVGGCWIVDDDGDTFDSETRKVVVPVEQCRDESGDVDEGLHAHLCEVAMEQAGYFPGVFSCDRHCNVSLIPTATLAARYRERK